MKIAIIGGGPCGLASLKHIATAHEYFDGVEPIAIRLFEAEKVIGGTFRYRTYRDAEVSHTTSVADATQNETCIRQY